MINNTESAFAGSPNKIAAHEPPLPVWNLSAPAHRTLDSLATPVSNGIR